MATLRRRHATEPWGAQVEQTVWERSQSGTPRRRRSDRPSLTHEPGWDWDGTQVLFTRTKVVSDGEERDCELCEFQSRGNEHSPTSLGGMHASLSLLDIASYRATKRRSKARSGLNDFEVVRASEVVSTSEQEPELGDSRRLGEWEKLDALGFKRTYSEVVQGFVDGEGLRNMPGCSWCDPISTEDDPWEYL